MTGKYIKKNVGSGRRSRIYPYDYHEGFQVPRNPSGRVTQSMCV